MPLTVAVIGRPNVGKSTLFNRLTGKRHAIVDDTPGVTRDRREGDGRIADLRFRLIDTAGLDDADDDSLEARMRRQTERAVGEADLVLFLIDGRAGLTPLDEHFADWLRARKTPILVLANKCEGGAGEVGRLDAYALGLGEPIPVSAEHGEGLGELYDAMVEIAPETIPDISDADQPTLVDSTEDEVPVRPLQLAIVGRPNVGKSTIVNFLLDDDRMLTGPEAGITRDAISISWEHDGRPIRLIDTAGLRRKARVSEKLENLSVGDTLRAVRFAEVVVLVLDSNAVLEKQDLTIARQVVDEGRALVIAVNKWDAAKNRDASLERLKDKLETSLPQIRGVPVITCSAVTGKGMDRLLPAVLNVHESWNRRISTGELNRWLQAMTEEHPPPVAAGRRVRIRYMTQAKTRPPTFVLFSSRAEKLPESYLRYLVNGLREDFDLPAVPIRLIARKGKNPYAE